MRTEDLWRMEKRAFSVWRSGSGFLSYALYYVPRKWADDISGRGKIKKQTYFKKEK